MALTRTEIAERIAKDDGDRDDEVFVNHHRSVSKSCYHSARDGCPGSQKAQSLRPWTRGDAQDYGLAPCRRCVLDDDWARTSSCGCKGVLERILEERAGGD